MNILAERSFPSFFKTRSAKLLKFYSDWLDWTELPGNAQYILNTLASEQDIDESVDAYRNHLRAKLIADFPERKATDLKLLLKTVLWLYRAKSSRKAYDFLFRVLYNSPAKIWHPRETMLRTCDGHWDIPQYFCIVPEGGETPIQFAARHLGWKAEGQSSGAIAFISSATAFHGEAEVLTSQIGSLCQVKLYETVERELTELEENEASSTPLQKVSLVNGHWVFDRRHESEFRLEERLIQPERSKKHPNDGITAKVLCDPLLSVFKIVLDRIPLEDGEEEEPFAGASTDLIAEFTIERQVRRYTIPAGQTELVVGGQDIRDVAVDLWRFYGDSTKEYLVNPEQFSFFKHQSREWRGTAFLVPSEDGSSLVPYQSEDAEKNGIAFLDGNASYAVQNGKPAVYLDRMDVSVSAGSDGTPVESKATSPQCIDDIETFLWLDYGTPQQRPLPDSTGEEPLWKARLEWNGSGLDFVLTHRMNDGSYAEAALADPAHPNSNISVTAAFDTYHCTVADGIEASPEDYRKGWKPCTAVISKGESRTGTGIVFLESDNTAIIVDRWNPADGTYRYNLASPEYSAFLDYDFETQQYAAVIRKSGRSGKWEDANLPYDVTAAFYFNGQKWEIDIPAGESSAYLTGKKADHQIVFADIASPWGIGIDSASMHFAPGERIVLTKPDNGEVSESTPVVWWHSESDGHYTTSHGFLSDINAIQDNHYWQNYSYVVQSYVGIREWRRIVRRLLHPAGLIFFGEVLLEGALEPGSGIMEMPDQDFLRRLNIFFRRMMDMSKQAMLWHQSTLATCRLAQTHSITSDLWLDWIRQHEEATDTVSVDLLRARLYSGSFSAEEKAQLQEILEEYAAQDWLPQEEKDDLALILADNAAILSKTVLTEADRRLLEAAAGRIEEKQSLVYGEDLRDWFDIRPSDVERFLNANSVLLFRNDGTLVDPFIVDWVDFSFISDIDDPFEFKGTLVRPHTSAIYGTTLHPSLPMIHGTVVGNYFAVPEDQEFIPKLHLAFVASTKPSNGSLVRLLNKNNEVLSYEDVARPDHSDVAVIRDENEDSLARRLTYFGSGPAGIVEWRELVLNDFIATPADGNLVFNQYSLMKVPDAWVEEREEDRAYVFSRNAWDNENGVVVSYSPFDFSYRIWLERSNDGIVCIGTVYNSTQGMECPIANANVQIDASETNVECIAVVKSGYTNEEREIYAATTEWKMSFSDIGRQSSWFEFKLPELVEPDRIWCFVNGLLAPNFRLDEASGTISVDTVKDNSKIVYDAKEWLFGELSLEEWVYVLDDDGNHVLLDEEGDPEDEANWKHELKDPDGPDAEENWLTKLVMVSVSESESVAFGEITLEDSLIIGTDMTLVDFGDITQQTEVQDIVACQIASSLSHTEIYILSPIEACRKLKYPWFNNSIELEDGRTVWPFTYDNARLFPFAAHGMDLTRRSVAEIAPDKEAVKPKRAMEVQWRKVRRLGTDFVRTFRTRSIAIFQRQSETVDRILETWWNDAPRNVKLDFEKNAAWLASTNKSSTMLFGEDGRIVYPEDFNWSTCEGTGGDQIGFPKKWWSVPLLAEKPVEEAVVVDGKIYSSEDAYKSGLSLVFADGMKILDTDIAKYGNLSYAIDGSVNVNGKKALVYSMGEDWLMKGDGRFGYFNAKKGRNGWTVSTLRNGSYETVETVQSVDWFDLVEFVGLSMDRGFGTIWAASEADNIFGTLETHDPSEIHGTTEIYWKMGDKRRFVDLRFLDEVDVLDPVENLRLFAVANNRMFGSVERIVDIDPRFLMVFIDGRYSPWKSGEWRYIKGTFFVECSPEKSVEVYIGNPLSYLRPDFAFCAPEDAGALAFNNLRVNIVPRHHLEAVFKHEFKLGTYFKRWNEVRWFKTFRWGITGYERERWVESLAVVQKQSETFDDVLYWHQMSPNAWLDEENPLKWSNRSSLIVFDSDGNLIDPARFDWHRRQFVPWSSYDTVEIMTLESRLYTGHMYFPGWEYDQTEGKVLHTELYPLGDGRTEGRYKDLVESNWNIVYIDGKPYDYEQWYSKQFSDLHLEEGVWVNEYPEEKQGENLLLTDILLNNVQDADTLTSKLWSFQIEAERESVRTVVLGSQNMELAVEVPSLIGAIVFVDGKKLPEGSFQQKITRNGSLYWHGTQCTEANVPSSGTVKQYVVLDSAVYGDSMEHVVAVYWPSKGYGTPIQSGNLCSVLYSNAGKILWDRILESACNETYDRPALQQSLTKLFASSGMLQWFKNWLATPNGQRLASAFGLASANPTAAQAAAFIVERKPEVLPDFLSHTHENIEVDKLAKMYMEWTGIVGIDAPLVQQFREFIESRYLLFVDGVHIPVSADSSGRIVLEIGGKHVFAEDYAPQSFELYCIDVQNSALRSSRAWGTETYEGLAFNNLRTFKLVEANTLAKLRRTFDWSIQYFIRKDSFKSRMNLFMERLGFVRTSKEYWRSKAELVSETIDEVIARGQMDPSAWAGLDFNIGAKASRSSLMTFDGNGGLIDPADIDFVDGGFNPKTSGKTVEIMLPSDGIQMARIYWPLYEASQYDHSLPFMEDTGAEQRYAELRETSFDTIYVDGNAYEVDRHFRKEVQDVHLEETAWIKEREGTVHEEGPYSAFVDQGWSNRDNAKIDAERFLLTDVPCDQTVEVNGSIASVSIDAENAVVREVQLVTENGTFRVFVPKLEGALVFIDGKKQREDAYRKQAWQNGVKVYDSLSVNYSSVPANAEYSIEFPQTQWKDNDEHTVLVYYPSQGWAARIASGSLANAVSSNLQDDWRSIGFESFNDYVRSRFVLFCGPSLAVLSGNADQEIFVNGVPLAFYSCSSFELYVVDTSNANCRVSVTEPSQAEQAFNVQSRQKNWFMEHHGQARWIRELISRAPHFYTAEVIEVKSLVVFPEPNVKPQVTIRSWTYTRNNRDTLDNVFVRGSLPVRAFMNPSLYVERITKAEISGLNNYVWIVLEQGEDPATKPWVQIDADEITREGETLNLPRTTLLGLEAMEDVVGDTLVYSCRTVPETWDLQVYATDRENPAWFLPCEKLPASKWRFYKGWNQRIVFFGLEMGKDIYIVETLDKSMEGYVSKTDQVYWLEKEFNKKSTLVLDKEGMLVHPDGLEWCDGKFVHPHSDTWTAQPEEAKFPAIINEMMPDNIKHTLVMDLCLNDMVGYNDAIALVADACLDSEVSTDARTGFKKPWGAIANRDYIYWEEGEFKNWNAWLRDDDVFDFETCFVFVNGFKIPDGQWTWHSDLNMVEVPMKEWQLVSRLEFLRREDILPEWIHVDNYVMDLIDEDVEDVVEFQESDGKQVFVDVMWATWWDKDGFPTQGTKDEIPEDAYIMVDHPDPREGIIWPVDRIKYRYYTAEVKAMNGRISVWDYYGHDLALYVLCFVDCRLVQCEFDGNTIVVPGWEDAEVIETYVFELNDCVWVDRFNANLPILNLKNLRDLKVC